MLYRKHLQTAIVLLLSIVIGVIIGAVFARPAHAAEPRPTVRVATFNALGHSHTDWPGGKAYGKRLKSAERTKLAVKIFDARHLDVIALQEFQVPQQRVFRKVAGQRYGLYCPASTSKTTHRSDNCIAWNRSSVQIKNRSYLVIPYFYGKLKRMPVATFIDRSSGKPFTVTSVHNPCSCEDRGNSASYRQAGWKREAARADRITAAGRAVFLMGDRNARFDAYRRHVPKQYIFAGRKGIDFIVRNKYSRFSGYTFVKTERIRRATDHPLVYVDAR